MNQVKLMALVAEYTANKVAVANAKGGVQIVALAKLTEESRMKLDYAMTEVFDELEALRAAKQA